MTHRYTLLIGGTVISGPGGPDHSAIAWAEDTVIAFGTDDEVRGISRGDSHVVDLHGACVLPLGDGPAATWPPGGTFEIGGRADLAVVAVDPRRLGGSTARRLRSVALVRDGRVVAGGLPGLHPDADHDRDHAPHA